MKEIIANILLVSLAAAFLGFLGCIWVKGSHYIKEPNALILLVEVLAILLVLCFAVSNLIKLAKERRLRNE